MEAHPGPDTAPLAPWNAALRFGLELGALVGLGAGAAELASGAGAWALAVAVPATAAVLWGTFRVPGDPGPAPVAVPGPVRLGVEALVLGGGVVGLAMAFPPWVWIADVVLLGVHHLTAGARLRWILAR